LIKVTVKYSFLIVVMLIITAGCGLKGNPVQFPTLPDKKPVVKNMEAVAADDSVVLKWNLQDKEGLVNYIDIERSEVGTRGNECKDCPRTYAQIGQILVKGAIPADKEPRALRFTDNNVAKERIYNYRLMLCDNNKNCSEASAIEINYK
jgi:predicted small lipoprotein YifL